MLLAVDVGNSNIVCGVWGDGKWQATCRFDTHPVDKLQYQKELDRLLNDFKPHISEVIVSSVVPGVPPHLDEVLNDSLACEVKWLDISFDLGITIQTNQPGKVGTDLIADAVAAYHIIQGQCIVVDFGTATTVMAVSETGILLGGSICAGLKMSNEVLSSKAARLFEVPLQPPLSVLGKNTQESVQSGLVLGHIAMVEGLVQRMKQEAGPAKVVSTGGYAKVLSPLTDLFDFVEPMLTLNGLRLIAERQGQ